jgi:hypothetical protein
MWGHSKDLGSTMDRKKQKHEDEELSSLSNTSQIHSSKKQQNPHSNNITNADSNVLCIMKLLTADASGHLLIGLALTTVHLCQFFTRVFFK